MNEEKIRQIVRSEIATHASGARFGLHPITRHTHNNVDSPLVLQPIVTYVGAINSNGGISIIPDGWTVLTPATGTYRVYHNLPSDAVFVPMATPYDVANPGVINITIPASNAYIQFDAYETAMGGSVLNGFYFTVTVINNRSLTLPTYLTFTKNA